LRRKKIYRIFYIVFGIFCFLVGVLYSNFLIRQKQTIGETKKVEYETKLINLSSSIISNAHLSVSILNDIARIWRGAIEENTNFNLAIQNHLFEEKDTLVKLKCFNEEIEKGLEEAKDCPPQYLESHIALMDMYGVYSQMFSLAQSPIGSLLGFSNKVNNLKSEFTRTLSTLKIYMPELKQLIEGALQESEINQPMKQVKGLPSNCSFDKILKKGMKLTAVERLIGVPQEKRRDALSREIWVYPSEKTGLYNRVYFIKGKVSEWR
jgi:hypothetical protein